MCVKIVSVDLVPLAAAGGGTEGMASAAPRGATNNKVSHLPCDVPDSLSGLPRSPGLPLLVLELLEALLEDLEALEAWAGGKNVEVSDRNCVQEGVLTGGLVLRFLPGGTSLFLLLAVGYEPLPYRAVYV